MFLINQIIINTRINSNDNDLQSNYRYVIQLKVENYTRKVCDEITMNILGIQTYN